MLASSRRSVTFILIFVVVITLSLSFLALPTGQGSAALAEPGSGWEVQEVDFVQTGVNAIEAVNEDIIWAVGGDYGTMTPHGFILKTTDGGENWISQGPEQMSYLNDVCAVNENTAWAVGAHPASSSLDAVILKTEDGGDNWSVQMQESGYVLMGISALNTDIALATGGKAVIENWQWKLSGTILVTTDGGDTWSPLLSSDSDFYHDVAIVNANVAWVTGSEVLKTTDGGVNWESKLSLPFSPAFPYGSISAVDENAVWLSNYTSIYRTNTGGESWQEFDPDTSDTYNDIIAVDEDSAWVAGGSLQMLDPGVGSIYRTVNGGNSWDIFKPGMPFYPAVYAFSDNTALVSGFIAMQKTDDGGLTWELQGQSGVDTSFFSIGALSSDFAMITGEDGIGAYAIPDTIGIMAWPGPTINAPVTEDFTSVSLLSEPDTVWLGFDAWMVGSNGMIYKMVAGPSTSPIQDSGTDNDLYDISALDVDTAWVVGMNVILKTSDSGTTWTTQFNAPLKINGVSAVDASTAWAVADGGIIGKTSDGTSWVAQPSGVSSNLYGVSAVDASTAWVVGAGGVVLKTTNGGAAWTPQASGTACDLIRVSAVDASTAWAVGAAGTIVKTTDGGTTWIRQDSHTSSNLYDICAVDADVAWAVGEHSTVLRTTDGGGPAVVFTLDSVTPASAAQYTWSMELQLSGAGFQTGATVRLEKGAAVLNAYNVNVVSANQITCTVGLFWAEPGAYDVVVTNPDGQEARLPGAFTVNSMCGQGSGAALLALGLALGLLSLAGTAEARRRGKKK